MKSKSFYAASLLLATTAAPALAQEAITTPILSSVSNFRDIAGVASSEGGSGTAYSTANDGVMRTDMFYRSNALSGVSAADEATLDTLHISAVIDLRTTSEVSGGPEIQNVPAGASYVNVNIFGTSGPPIPSLSSAASVQAYLEAMNRGFVTDATERANFATVFADLADATGPAIYNCSSGKDRTGWVSAVLDSIAGMSSANIMANYLATDVYSASAINAAYAVSPGYGTVLGVQAPDLQAGLDQIIASYGSLDNYLINGLGMSQAEIYVLRAKMVDYLELPGQAGMTGNAASGAMLLNALQDSKLSGAYTAYNYYLQSAIDAGTLGGVQNQVGGQVVADTVSYLARLPQLTNAIIAPDTSGQGLAAAQTKIWDANLAGVLSTDGDDNVAGSTSHSAGLLIGATHRFGEQTALDAGLGYNWGGVDSAGGSTQSNLFLMTAGARYAFTSLEAGPYIAAGANADLVNTHDDRNLGGGLGQATGDTNGAVFDEHAEIGNVFAAKAVTLTPQLGFDVAQAHLRSFTEQGSELALSYGSETEILPSLTGSIAASMPAAIAGAWHIAPTATLGYTRLLSSPVVTVHGAVLGYGITTLSAFNSRDIGTLAMDVKATNGRLSLDAGVIGVVGDANTSTGISGRLAVTYMF